jgi:hypothetical protein
MSKNRKTLKVIPTERRGSDRKQRDDAVRTIKPSSGTLTLPANCRDVTLEKSGMVFGIVGVPRPKAT